MALDLEFKFALSLVTTLEFFIFYELSTTSDNRLTFCVKIQYCGRPLSPPKFLP